MAEKLSLSSILVPSKDVEVDYPGMPGFKVKLTFLSRDSLVSLRKKATKVTFKNRQQLDELDDDLFLKMYVNATVKGWEGLKLAYVERLLPVELNGKNPEDLLEYSEDNALMLMKNSTDFDGFVSDIISDLGNFSKSSSKASN